MPFYALYTIFGRGMGDGGRGGAGGLDDVQRLSQMGDYFYIKNSPFIQKGGKNE